MIGADSAVLDRYIRGMQTGFSLSRLKQTYATMAWLALAKAGYPAEHFFREHPSYSKFDSALSGHARQCILDRVIAVISINMDDSLAKLLSEKRLADRQKRAAAAHIDAIRQIEHHVAQFKLGIDPADLGTIDLVLAFYWAQDVKARLLERKIDFVWTSFATTPVGAGAFRMSDDFQRLFINNKDVFECYARQAASAGRREIEDWAQQVCTGISTIDTETAKYDLFIVQTIADAQKRFSALQNALDPLTFKQLVDDMRLKSPVRDPSSGLCIEEVD